MDKFLKERGIEDDVIQKLRDEKIDKEAVSSMSDEDLAKYIRHHGDRLALKRFCNRKSSDGEKKKNSLLEKLRRKLNDKRKNDSSAASESEEETPLGRRITRSSRQSKQLRGNINAKKNVRRIDIGWILKENGETKQIRTKKGGGTRKLTVDKDTTNHDLLERAKELFFPNGKSAFGLSEDFIFELWDYAQNKIDGTVTVSEMYDQTKLGTIRVYLASVRKSDDEEDSTCIIEKAARMSGIHDSCCTDDADEPFVDVLPDLEPDRNNNQTETSVPEHEVDEFTVDSLLRDMSESRERSESTGNLDESEVTFPHLYAGSLLETESIESFDLPVENRKIEVNEGRILIDMLTAFKYPDILNADINICRKFQGAGGEEVESREGSGMTRDILTEFWSEFYQQCTVGCTYKVPFTRHDYQKEEWLAVARIIYKGWQSYKYFPVEIAPTIFEECLYGFQKTDISKVFLRYLSESEASILQRACTDFKSVDMDDIIDVLSTHSGRHMPTEDNLKAMCNEIANKELVQDTKFVTEAWKTVLVPLGRDLKPGDLQLLYQSMIPSAKKIIAILRFPAVVNKSPLNGQDDTTNYLKKFLKESDQTTLGQFLRFCTGSNLLLPSVKEIEIEFTHLEGLSRRPIAHTCGCVLKLSDNYANFPEFRSEFNAVLKSGIWLMDIV